MDGNGRSEKEMTRRQEAFLSVLLAQPTIAAAAKTANVPETTARRWLREPDFVRAYRDARRQSVEHSTAIIQAATSAAVAALLRNVREDAPAALQVRAAAVILEHAARAVETVDLAERIEALEATLKVQTQTRRKGIRAV
jgi:hypothetical protein